MADRCRDGLDTLADAADPGGRDLRGEERDVGADRRQPLELRRIGGRRSRRGTPARAARPRPRPTIRHRGPRLPEPASRGPGRRGPAPGRGRPEGRARRGSAHRAAHRPRRRRPREARCSPAAGSADRPAPAGRARCRGGEIRRRDARRPAARGSASRGPRGGTASLGAPERAMPGRPTPRC